MLMFVIYEAFLCRQDENVTKGTQLIIHFFMLVVKDTFQQLTALQTNESSELSHISHTEHMNEP